MAQGDPGTQENRSETVAMRVTPSEKRAFRWVADGRGQAESDLLREMTIGPILEEYDRLRSILEQARPTPEAA